MESLTGGERGREARSGEAGCTKAAERSGGAGAEAGGGAPAEVVAVGSADAVGRVLSLVDALVVELSGLSLEGADRGVLRAVVAALGRVRAGADAAEARAVNALEGLGDGGVDATEVLRRNTGSSQREARRRRRRANTLAGMPNVAGALARGDISAEHADALVRAAGATSADAVDADAGLLAQVAAVPADRAGRHIGEWTQRHQDPRDLHELHLRQRRRRRLHFGDGDDGMLMAHAAFDRVLGAQFRSVINGIADRIWRAEGGRDNPEGRTVEQRRLDALAIAVGLHPGPTDAEPAAGTTHGRAPSGGAGDSDDLVAGDRDAGGRESRPDGQDAPIAARGRADGDAGNDESSSDGQRTPLAAPDRADNGAASDGRGLDFGHTGGNGRGHGVDGGGRKVSPRHQVVIVASADVISGTDPQGRCEIPGVGPIPQTELERLACGAELFGLLFSGDGEPLWHGRGERAATDAQRRALVARDGGCVLCAAEPAWCEAHHIVPWARPGEGPTDIDNLALLCNTCHHRLHDHKRVLVGSPANGWTTAPDPRHAAGGASHHPRRAADRRRSTTQATSRKRWSACRSGPPATTVEVSGRTRPRGRPPDLAPRDVPASDERSADRDSVVGPRRVQLSVEPGPGRATGRVRPSVPGPGRRRATGVVEPG